MSPELYFVIYIQQSTVAYKLQSGLEKSWGQKKAKVFSANTFHVKWV